MDKIRSNTTGSPALKCCVPRRHFSAMEPMRSGRTITLTADDRKNQPETGFVRVEEEGKDEGRTWVEALYLLRTSAVDGWEYEVRYNKN
jgi:hypothetical protein